MNYYSDSPKGFGSHCVSFPRWCLSTEDYNERQNDYTNIIEEKMVSEWFYWTYCVDCEEHREFTNNVCPYQATHKVSISCDKCGKVYIDYYYRYKYKPTCSHDCYLKYNTIPCIDSPNSFLRTCVSIRCSSCSVLITHKLEKYNPEELRSLANIYKIKGMKKEYIRSELLQINHLIF